MLLYGNGHAISEMKDNYKDPQVAKNYLEE